MAPTLTTLSPEILHEICLNVDPKDLARLARTCHFLEGFIRRDDLLWKLQYLNLFVRCTQVVEHDLMFTGRTILMSRARCKIMAKHLAESRVSREDT